MEMDSFAKLEERISKAIAHIDDLTQKCRRLEEENGRLNGEVQRLAQDLKGKETALAQLEAESLRASELVKEKVQGLLQQIDRYDQSRLEF